MTNYLMINKKGELKQILCDRDKYFTKYYAEAVRRGWTIIKGEENEGYIALVARILGK